MVWWALVWVLAFVYVGIEIILVDLLRGFVDVWFDYGQFIVFACGWLFV